MYRSLETPRDWTEHMTELLMTQGVPLVGVSTKQTLAGGPPSTDLEYVLPGAKSAITFAVPLDQNKIELYLSTVNEALPRTRIVVLPPGEPPAIDVQLFEPGGTQPPAPRPPFRTRPSEGGH